MATSGPASNPQSLVLEARSILECLMVRVRTIPIVQRAMIVVRSAADFILSAATSNRVHDAVAKRLPVIAFMMMTETRSKRPNQASAGNGASASVVHDAHHRRAVPEMQR
jgi:hypothetical protein